VNTREEFNEELVKLKESYEKAEVSNDFSFSEYCVIYYNKLQADNILRIDLEHVMM